MAGGAGLVRERVWGKSCWEGDGEGEEREDFRDPRAVEITRSELGELRSGGVVFKAVGSLRLEGEEVDFLGVNDGAVGFSCDFMPPEPGLFPASDLVGEAPVEQATTASEGQRGGVTGEEEQGRGARMGWRIQLPRGARG